MPMYTTKITAGDVIEKFKYYSRRVPGKKEKTKREKKNESTELQKLRNYNNAQLYLNRLANLNFDRRDLFATLSYQIEPRSIEEAERMFANFLKRLRRHRKRHNMSELKYIVVTESDGVRIHHHILISGMSIDALGEIWKHGDVKATTMRRRCDYKGITNYLTKEPRKKGERRWTSSTNLIKPIPETKLMKNPKKELTAPKGYIKIAGEPYKTEYGMFEYARYIKIDGFDCGFGKSAPDYTYAEACDQITRAG